MDKRLKELPWEEYKGMDEETYSISIFEPVIDGERVFIITFSLNPAYVPNAWQAPKKGMRYFCYKKSRQVFACDTEGRSKKEYLERGLWDDVWHAQLGEREKNRLDSVFGKVESVRSYSLANLDIWIRRVCAEMKIERRRMAGEIMKEEAALCPEELPEGLSAWIRQRILREDNVLVHKKGNVKGLCYACSREVEAIPPQRFRNNEYTHCPDCGTKVLCQRKGSDSWKADNVNNIVAIQKGLDGETVFFRQWSLLRDTTAKWESIEPYLLEVARYAIRGTKTASWLKERKANYYTNYDYEYLDEWAQCSDNRIYDGFYIFYDGGAKEALADTVMQYADLDGYLSEKGRYQNPIYFLEYFAKYPVTEFLWKAGYRGIVHQKIYGASKESANVIYWKRKKVKDCFKFPLHFLKIRPPEEWTLEDMRITQELWEKRREQLIPSELCAAIRLGKGVEDIKAALPYVSIQKVEKYLSGQVGKKEPAIQRQNAMRQICMTYRDYLRECGELGLQLTDKQVLFPPNLDAAHQRTMSQISFEKNKADKEQFAKQVERWESLAWEGVEYLIRPARKQKELQEEGRVLDHCVGGYIKSMAEGHTAIFFIRKKQEPDRPFFTLELDPNTKRMRQCRTLQNVSSEKDPAVSAFINEWMKKAVNKKAKRKTA